MLIARTACAALLLSVAPAAFAAPESGASMASSSSASALRPIALTSADIPAEGRFVLVDAASAQLYMIEDGEVRDSMRVIVGKPGADTPTIRSTIHAATLNPYWHVPTDLARTIMAPRVLKDGTSYLRERGYEVLSSFGDDAYVLPAGSVDWQAVADGTEKVYLRQKPGPANSMGTMKFGFPNQEGIYLHDTPRKELFDEAERNLSAGCVRLEDAPRLARWLLDRKPSASSKMPEQNLPLPEPVPIMIAYLEAPAPLQLAALR